MPISPHWRRIAGIATQEEGGVIGAVWLAHDRDTDCLHLYDCCKFAREAPAVIAEGLNARGRWIPIAWEKSARPIADQLLERGCNTTYEPFEDDPVVAEVISRDIWERMRTGRFRVDKRNREWLDEFKEFRIDDNKIPVEGFPLMTATRNAFGLADHYARAQETPGAKRQMYPDLAII